MPRAPLRLASLLAIVILLGVAATALAASVDGERPACVGVTATARWGALAYDHVVQIANRCEAAVTCRVSTNANPTVSAVRVEAGSSKDLVTFRGSPASDFTAHVDCELTSR